MSSSYFHPLTDEIIDTFASPQYDSFEGIGDVNCGFTYDDLRAAADWQLEQVIEYLEKDLEFVLWSDSFMKNFKEAMRPTNTQENS